MRCPSEPRSSTSHRKTITCLLGEGGGEDGGRNEVLFHYTFPSLISCVSLSLCLIKLSHLVFPSSNSFKHENCFQILLLYKKEREKQFECQSLISNGSHLIGSTVAFSRNDVRKIGKTGVSSTLEEAPTNKGPRQTMTPSLLRPSPLFRRVSRLGRKPWKSRSVYSCVSQT